MRENDIKTAIDAATDLYKEELEQFSWLLRLIDKDFNNLIKTKESLQSFRDKLTDRLNKINE